MAKRRRRKKNPTTTQWIVLGVGGAVGLGLLGYGINLAVKNRKAEKQLGTPESAGAPEFQWQFTLRPVLDARGTKWTAIVYEPGGTNPQMLPGYQTRGAAAGAAQGFIVGRGGTPVYRAKTDEVVQDAS